MERRGGEGRGEAKKSDGNKLIVVFWDCFQRDFRSLKLF
jgi:hypothetical protein